MKIHRALLVLLTTCIVESNVGSPGGGVWVDATSTQHFDVVNSDFASNTTDTVYSYDVKTSYSYGTATTFSCTTTGCAP